jgi:hypothetical protein
MEAAMRAVRQQHSGPVRLAVALGNMFAGGLPFNWNNRTFIARLLSTHAEKCAFSCQKAGAPGNGAPGRIRTSDTGFLDLPVLFIPVGSRFERLACANTVVVIPVASG